VMAAMAKDPARRPATMELYGEQIAALAATLPPATGQVSAQGSGARPVAPVITPQPPTPVPSATTPAPYVPTPAAYVPPPIPPTTRAEPRTPGVPAAAATSRRVLVFVVIGVGLIGGGIAAYLATRPHHDEAPEQGNAAGVDPWRTGSAAAASADAAVAAPPGVDPWNVSAPQPDPWNTAPPKPSPSSDESSE